MTPTILFLLFLLLMAIPQAATQEELEDESSDVTDIISKVNENITRGIEHGDIMIPQQRNAVPCTSRGCKWPKSGRYVYVPFIISPLYSRTQRNAIIRALLTFHRSTCIRFIGRKKQRSYLYFYSGSGCFSFLGRRGGGQIISLKRQGCLSTGVVQHEVLHALGFHHEQVRSDRDAYVTIFTNNIQPGKERNFIKVQTNNLGTRYDYRSVMHYRKYAFSKNGRPTVVAKTNPNQILGASYMGVNDIARINRLYRCRLQ